MAPFDKIGVMANGNGQLARRFHEATKHSPVSVRTNPHFLDWENEPARYKDYPEIDPIPLPMELPRAGLPAARVVSAAPEQTYADIEPSLKQIAYLLYHSGGITKKILYPHGELYFRAAACAGALYPIEIYLVCGDLSGLKAGVYHFSPRDFALHPLRRGDYRAVLTQASAGEEAVSQAAAVIVLTAITWRSSWKYQTRSYRYHYWDSGTILANGLAAAQAQGLQARVVMGFVDRKIDHLLGIDGESEKSICLMPVGRTQRPHPEAPPAYPTLDLTSSPASTDAVRYPLIEHIHADSQLNSPAEVASYRKILVKAASRPEGVWLRPAESSAEEPDAPSLEWVIIHRGSTRQFQREAVSLEAFSKALEGMTRGFHADWLPLQPLFLNDLYLNVHAVEGVPPGAYVYHPDLGELEELKRGDFRSDSAYLCLGQELGGDAGFTIFFLADLKTIFERYGSRGYRLAQIEAGILGGKLYLMAYALGLGATGLTFFDDLTVNFFSPHALGKDAIFVAACGLPQRPHQPRGRLVYLQPG
ncbi:MAG: SagB/ThcOx family dehydrogenase, partial [Armatimonadetes bacterium]|nr:SagB/ThcOx family dehydrogenase [Armatimonadota bacterium]NIO97726.1 SagB/ThcOx family dehydrogenase [Armatimonadota bacterium]